MNSPDEMQYSKENFFGNYYINNKNPHPTTNLFRSDPTHQMYNEGNWYGEASANGTITGAHVIAGNISSYFNGPTLVSTPFAVTGVSADTRETAEVALQRVRDYSGMNWQNRTEVDQAIIAKIGDSDFNSINDLSGATQAAQWNTLMAQRPDAGGNAPFTRAAGFDTDNDGMPNAWEAARGTNPSAANNNADFDNDGYTDLEEYINELAAWPASKTLVFGNANGNSRYAEINNWGNIWQPSRFDSAQVNAGTLTVDAAGQEARNLTVATSAGSTAALQLTGGWLDIRETLGVGPGGTGSVTQTAGLVRAGTAVVIGGASPGTYNLSGGTLATPLLKKGNAASTFNFTGGVLHADKVEFGFTNNGGTIAPGSDAFLQMLAAASMKDINGSTEAVQPFVGTTQVADDLTLASGLLQIDLASETRFDQLIVDGALALGGNLGIVLDDGYTPAVGTEWLIGTAGSDITGNFASITPGFTTRTVDGKLYLTTVPEPTVVPAALAGLALISRRRRTKRDDRRH
jgi:hypothetical protein